MTLTIAQQYKQTEEKLKELHNQEILEMQHDLRIARQNHFTCYKEVLELRSKTNKIESRLNDINEVFRSDIPIIDMSDNEFYSVY
ncbi:hypothetical protein [Lactobacillus gasseri]|uniref:hypothetical protein n=1 Tax=Lactobacillus gasseri TaxID=1596 RepID=UPI001191B40F|nr:hypothetical protein [Lactobacillus gasseri]TVU93487.1 hypothetical protein FOF75_02515 [Lactobacillus gasseri]TVV14780.1 hypothetical protein FOF66_07110 [Lactobacillus gasseri]